MKAIVLESKENMTAILKADGTVENIPGVYEVGSTIELAAPVISMNGRKNRKSKGNAKTWAAAAAAAVFIGLGGTAFYTQENLVPYSTITIDVKPSIEYQVNKKNKVLAVNALNQDAEPIVDELITKGVVKKDIIEAFDETKDLLYEYGYLSDDDDDYILANVVSKSDKQRDALAYSLEKSAEDDATLTVSVNTATKEEEVAAKDLGISTGRYVEYKKSVDADDYATKPVKDIIDGIQEEQVQKGAPAEKIAKEEISSSTPIGGGDDDSQNLPVKSPHGDGAPQDTKILSSLSESTTTQEELTPASSQEQPTEGVALDTSEDGIALGESEQAGESTTEAVATAKDKDNDSHDIAPADKGRNDRDQIGSPELSDKNGKVEEEEPSLEGTEELAYSSSEVGTEEEPTTETSTEATTEMLLEAEEVGGEFEITLEVDTEAVTE
ncbi:MAG: hypothetical protein IKO61_06200 [Lachnospiraceae bacterium]|nr:hypothetical protein [Lachnospiraceae bacterium]